MRRTMVSALVLGLPLLLPAYLSAAPIPRANLPASSWERALLRAAGNPARCGRFLIWELERAPRGHFLQLHAPQLGCSDITLPPTYRREATATGEKIWRTTGDPLRPTDRLVAQLVTDAPARAVARLTVHDRRPGWTTRIRHEAGVQIIDVVLLRQGETP